MNKFLKKNVPPTHTFLTTVKQWFRTSIYWYVRLYKGHPWYIKLFSGIISFFLFILLYLGAVGVNFLWLFGKSPSIHSIMNPENSEASLLYSADSVLIGKYFNENRSPVKYEEVNPIFYKALIDTEDERFYSHHGVDFQGLLAAVKDMFHGHARGASTLTQQLVKNMFRVRTEYSTGLLGKIPGIKMLIMKSKEWILATELEMLYEKKEILTMYVNTVDFGSNAFGIKTAAKTYFNTTPDKLTAEQAAVLVGLLKATSTYNPRINPKNSLRRRNTVLANMWKHNHLTTVEFDSISKLPLELDFSVETAYDGKALYFRQAVASHLKEWCTENGIDLYADGLKIYTTLNMSMQRYAEEAVNKQMRVVQRNFNNHWGKQEPWQDERHQVIKNFISDLAKRTEHYRVLNKRFPNDPDSVTYYLNEPHLVTVFDYEGPKEMLLSTMDSIRYMVRFMHTGFVAIEPDTRHVKAWVGDIDFDSWKYDKVTAMRQPGSTFKLFVYTEAMNQGLAPCDRRTDCYISMNVMNNKGELEPWRPHNANGYFTNDSMSLKAAFAQSINSVAVKLGMEVGIENVIKTAKAMGIKSPMQPNPSLSLGSADVNLLELVNSYATVANDGKAQSPILVTHIVNRHGKTIYTAPNNEQQAIPYRSAFYMQQLLQGGLRERGGTSMALWSYIHPYTQDTEFGGKTGTSNNHSDAWFVGITPGLVAGVWVGGEYRSIHFRTGALGQGSRTALPIFGYFVQSLLKDPSFKKYRRKFAPAPADIPYDTYNCPSYITYRSDSDSIQITADTLLEPHPIAPVHQEPDMDEISRKMEDILNNIE